ncbi:xanthotoxin 5-hydroxylase CYP82C4-like [Solanum stenotomum]|uniref:xanthotoxin 5-hydroxylase CYP82C4-like n=1 Tax=Solanum stenotomum TaxID=172797 RepID=UPI0020D19BB9|nr:xanthotoxin 5-hydroxylase CYP82C4-like [Solanum stenotomum]
MEFDLLLLLLSPMEAIAALLTLAFLFYFILSTKKTSKLPLPPEIAGGWPVIGHLFYFNNDGDNRPLARKLSDLADKYGPVFTFRVGLHRVLVISSYDAVKECYTKNDAVFANRPACLYGEYIGYNNAILFLANYGSYWRNIRKLIIQEVLSNSRLEKLKYMKIEKIRNYIKNLHSRIQNSEEKSVINLTDWLEKMNFGLIVKMIAGKNYESGGDGDEEVERFRESFKKFLVLSMEFVLWDAFPIRLFKWIDFQGHVKLMKKTFKDIDSISQRWLDEHVKRRSTEVNGDGNYERDFIDVMLSKMSDERLHEGHSRDTTIKATVFSMIMDAADTVPHHINWGMTLLINNQHVLKKAQEEIDTKVGKARWIDDNDIKNLVYLQAIVKEMLRLYPPSPLLVPHENTKECVVSGYHIPKGTRLYANVMKLQLDPKVWPNPEQFNPDRFLTTDINFRGQDYEFIPFGSGRRSCPGISYALQMEHLTIGHLIQGFDYRTPSNEPLDMKEGLGMTMPKVNPVEVIITPRLASELYKI